MSIWTLRLGLFALSILVMRPLGVAASDGIYLQNPDGGSVRGLIIGIDAYQHVRQLKGAVADARDIEQSLRSMGINDVSTLLDARASREVILQTIGDLLRRTKPNDLIVLSIAGHGAQ